MGRRHYFLLRRRQDTPIRRREGVTLKCLGDVPLRRSWVLHLRRTCHVTGTYRLTSLRRHHDVLLPGGTSPRNKFSEQQLIIKEKFSLA